MAIDIEERICMECNKPFKTRSQNFMCPDCIRKVLADSQSKPVSRDDIRAELGYLPVYKPRKEVPQIVKDANEAAKLRVSYGQYIADYKGKKRR